MGAFRILTTAAMLALTLAGCGSRTSVAPADTQFVAGSPDAIVLIGLRSTTPIVTKGSRSYPDFRMIWELLPSPALKRDTPRLLMVDTAEKNELFGERSAADISMHVARVPAGTYYLRAIVSGSSESRYLLQPMGSPGAPFFTVKPGEVRYIGDLHCDVLSRPARCDRLTRSDTLAYGALAEYPGIRIKPHFRPPAYNLATDEPAKAIAVSE
jgi:hypothetical protein